MPTRKQPVSVSEMVARHTTSTAARAAVFASALMSAVVAGGAAAVAQVTPDMVSRTALRVCSDPSNLPFSNRKKTGFENKIAEIVGGELKQPVRYFWAPSGPGFVRNTLNSDLCDVVMGYTIGSEMVQATNPYYRSTYVLVAPKGSSLNGIASLDDPRLKGERLGVYAATPPVDVMLAKGLMDKATVYPLLVDHRFDSPLNDLLEALKAKTIDAAIVWGPLIGDAVKTSGGSLVATPLVKDVDKPGFSYRISFGIRHDEPDWKHKLEAVIRARKADIDKVLEDYGVPLLDNQGRIIQAQTVASETEPKLEPAVTGGPRTGKGPMPVPKTFVMPGPAPSNAKP